MPLLSRFDCFVILYARSCRLATTLSVQPAISELWRQHLVLSAASMMKVRHESVMSIVINGKRLRARIYMKVCPRTSRLWTMGRGLRNAYVRNLRLRRRDSQQVKVSFLKSVVMHQVHPHLFLHRYTREWVLFCALHATCLSPVNLLPDILGSHSCTSITSRLEGGGLCLCSTATLHTWRGEQLWLQRLTHQGQLTTAPYSSSLAG